MFRYIRNLISINILISKFDLYKHEWLELVFENRNKVYGAYELRQHYASNMVRAMGFTFFGLSLLCGASIVFKTTAPLTHITHVDMTPPIVAYRPPTQPKPPAPTKPLKADHPASPAATIKYTPPIVVDDSHAAKEQMKKNDALTVDIGTVDKGKPGGTTVPVEITGNGPTTVPVDGTVHTISNVDVMPEPIGGEAAWNKFLSKNLRFPDQAQDARVSGRVILSFVIEKDGHLSNIVVERSAGYGFDEEAVRVLKMAKAWKPGMQNGQAVRVRYMIPINFQLSE